MPDKLQTEKHKGFTVFEDLRTAIVALEEKKKAVYYIHKIPLPPKYNNRYYTYYNQRVNPYRLECSCEAHKEKSRIHKSVRDYRRVCRHLFAVLKYKTDLDSLTSLILESQIKFGEEKLIKRDVDGRIMLVGFKNVLNDEWLNVYTQSSVDKNNYIRYSFNRNEKRWSYGAGPVSGNKMESLVKLLTKTLLKK